MTNAGCPLVQQNPPRFDAFQGSGGRLCGPLQGNVWSDVHMVPFFFLGGFSCVSPAGTATVPQGYGLVWHVKCCVQSRQKASHVLHNTQRKVPPLLPSPAQC